VGIGVYNPFGLSNDWGKTWIGRYSATYSELNAIFVTPTVAYKFNDSVSAGFGFSYVTSSVDLQNMLPFTPYPDGRAKLTGSGDGLGVNAGVRIKLPQQYTLAFTARSPTKIKYDGEAKFYTPNDTIFKALYPALRDSDVSTTITLPWQLTGGIAKQIGALTLEVDVVYIGWSTIDHYRVKFDDGRQSALYNKDWYDTFSFGAGANYRWSPSLETQLGYMYDMGCVPQRTMTPDLPDASKHILTAGIGYTAGPIKANLAYQATFFQRASSVNNIVSAPSGRYNQFLQIILLSLSYSR
jgi:long-chain fatty acid transport protein